MLYSKEKKSLHLIINGIKYEWFEQYITGVEIRKLGSIAEQEQIFLKIEEPWQDEPVGNDTKVDLARPGLEHFSSKEQHRQVTIIVNSREKKWNKPQISFRDVIEFAFGTYIDKATMVYTVAYEDGPRQNAEGSMLRKDVVFVKNQMIFHATATDKS